MAPPLVVILRRKTSALVKRYVDEPGRREVLAGAETLAAALAIRTLDAIHVASAQLFAARISMPGLTFVSADKRQTETAVAVGLVARHIE